MSKLRKIFLAVRDGYLWYRVQVQTEKQDYNGALRNLERMFRTPSLSIETDMMKAQILNAQLRHPECLVLCNSLVLRIPEDAKMSEPEKAYCIAYLKWLADLSSPGRSEKLSKLPKLSSIIMPDDYEKIELSQIKKRWKANFPLRIHPRWTEVSM